MGAAKDNADRCDLCADIDDHKIPESTLEASRHAVEDMARMRKGKPPKHGPLIASVKEYKKIYNLK